MSKKPTLTDLATRGYQLAQRPEGVARHELAAKWKSNIGWKKYLDMIATREGGMRVKVEETEDGVVYRVVAARAAKKPTKQARA